MLRFRSRAAAMAVFTASLSGILGGCTSSSSSKILRIHLSGDPVSLDPSRSEDGLAMRVLGSTSDRLIGYFGPRDPEGKGEFRLAEKCGFAKAGLQIRCRIRAGAKWSDGVAVTAEQFVLSLRRVLHPETASKLAELLYPIKGAKAFQKDPTQTLGLAAPDAQTLVIDLEEPAPYLMKVLALHLASPQRQDVLDANDGNWPTVAPSTGPYRIDSYELGQKIVLVRNEYFWGQAALEPRVEFIIVQDGTTAVNLFTQGQLHVLSRFDTLARRRVSQAGAIVTSPFVATYYLGFNTRKAPFDDRDLRRAVAGSIDRQAITEVLGGGEHAAWSWIPRGIEGFVPYRDPRKVFASAIQKVRATKKSPALASFDSSDRNQTIMEKVQADLKTHLGMKVVLENRDWKAHVGAITSDPEPIYRFGWLAPFLDPIVHLRAYTSNNSNNYSKWKNVEYDRLVAEVGRLEPGKRRTGLIRRAQKILLEEEAVVVPIFHYVQNHGVRPEVDHFRVDPFGMIAVSEMKLSSAE